MINLHRIRLFATRWIKARKYGFAYRGTTKTMFPNALRIGGKDFPIAEPIGNECVYDLFNVLLDDEYGLGNIQPKPAVIVDIGANMGIFALAAWSRYPDAKIHAYEPNPSAYQKAAGNLRPTGLALYNEAVGKEAGLCDIEDHSQSRLARTVSSEQGRIPVTPLSGVIMRAGGAVDLLKMDCEGAEWDIMEDLDSLRKIRSIRMEYHLTQGRSLEDFTKLVARGCHKIIKIEPQTNHGIAWLENTLGRA